MTDWERVRRLSIVAGREIGPLLPAYATVSAILVLSRYALRGVPADADTLAAIEKIFDAQDEETRQFLDTSAPHGGQE